MNQQFEAMMKDIENVIATNNSDPEKLHKCMKLITAKIGSVRKMMKSSQKTGHKNRLISVLSRLQGYRTKLKARKIHTGSGLEKKITRKEKPSDRVKWTDVDNVFDDRIRTGIIVNLKHKDPLSFLEDCGALFSRRIRNQLIKDPFLKINSELCGLFVKSGKNKHIEDYKYLKTKSLMVNRDTVLEEWFALNIMIPLMESLEEFQERDSGWAISSIISLSVNINKYTPQLGSSYIALPEEIKRKKACINVKNQDNACFAWAVTSALFPKGHGENPTRTSSYPHYTSVLKLDGLTFPINREQIEKFEKMNGISINVYILNRKINKYSISPSKLTANKQKQHVNLLLLQNKYLTEDEFIEEPIIYHYVWIKNLSRLVSNQLNKRNGKCYVCDRCLHYFHTNEKLIKHQPDCEKENNYKVVLPGGKLSFSNYNNKEKCPFILYADIECLLKPISSNFGMKKINGCQSSKIQEHEACAIGYYFKCSYNDSLSFQKQYRGPDCAKWFANELKVLAEEMETVYLCDIPMVKLSPDEEIQFQNTLACHICEQHFNKEDIRVRDHCHLTGKYRGAAHEKCNLNYKDSKTVPIVFHNLSGYDLHFILKDVALNMEGNVKLIPNNQENFISMIKYIPETGLKYKFIDSFRFMPESLANLSSYLEDNPIVKSEFTGYNEEQIKLLTRKGVYPYDYMKSWQCMEETKLPNLNEFYSNLYECNISNEDYQHAHKVWREFQIQTLGQYMDLYLKIDILLLAEVFETFREICLTAYKLDPAHYYTAPGLSWDAMLKKTQIKLELIEDVDILMFLEKGVRGGLTQCSKRHSKANNKYTKNYDPSMKSNFLMYYDINAMYSWAMSQYLPYKNLKWVEESVADFNYNKPDNNPIGYILEVDLEYPEAIHDRHQDLPMAPSRGSPPGSKQQKMLATLYSKKNYVVHYRNLKQYIAEGLLVNKIHRVLQFEQSPWLSQYIELNTALRRNAKNEFEKVFFKLMNNAVFGKTMENVRNRRNIRLVTKWNGRYGAEALISKPNFHSRKIIDKELVLIELLKTEAIFNKPIYVGMSILDISKTVLYNFHYNYMKDKYGDLCRLCYTDTDSLIYEIETEDVYEDMKQNVHLFDTSDYDANNSYGIPLVNKKTPGKMKDENQGAIMEEFVGLRAKMYACKVACQNDTKKAKGIKSYVVKNQIKFEDYLNSLYNNEEMEHMQNSIRSFAHHVFTTKQCKISLSPYDDKRQICRNNIDTLPWGHYSTKDALML